MKAFVSLSAGISRPAEIRPNFVPFALKVSARNKKRRDQKLNFAERHPTLTDIGAALGTRHAIKSTTHHRHH